MRNSEGRHQTVEERIKSLVSRVEVLEGKVLDLSIEKANGGATILDQQMIQSEVIILVC